MDKVEPRVLLCPTYKIVQLVLTIFVDPADSLSSFIAVTLVSVVHFLHHLPSISNLTTLPMQHIPQLSSTPILGSQETTAHIQLRYI